MPRGATAAGDPDSTASRVVASTRAVVIGSSIGIRGTSATSTLGVDSIVLPHPRPRKAPGHRVSGSAAEPILQRRCNPGARTVDGNPPPVTRKDESTMAKYAAPGESGSVVQYKPRYDHFIGGECVAPAK